MKFSTLFKRLLVAAAAIIALSACGTTYHVDRSRTLLDPYGPNGTTTTFEVAGKAKCVGISRKSTLSVHADIAKRICAAFPKRCKWTDPEVAP